jgi:hypothetical protein
LIVGEQLQLSLQYSGQQQRGESMQQLAQAYVARLQQLIAQASQAERCPYIPGSPLCATTGRGDPCAVRGSLSAGGYAGRTALP